MTDPGTLALDQAVIDAGKALLRAQMADPRDPDVIGAARQELQAALDARWPNG